MSVIQTDVKRMNEDGNALLNLANKYSQYINNLKLNTSKNDAWQGLDAETFKQDLKDSFVVYEEVFTILKEYANFLILNSREIDLMASKDLIK